jgi:hypothetical protein
MTIVSQEHIKNTITLVIDSSINILRMSMTIVSEDHIKTQL